jgi:EpsD family peptidyl-prolyl cis-trans isomerase
MERAAYALPCKLLIATLAFAAAGCERAAADRASQIVLARVNGAQISAASVAPAAGAASRDSVREALEKVIDRELCVQRALELGLERDAQVSAAIDTARRQILAQAYIDRVAASPAGHGASVQEVRAFYAENPALFAERRIYRLRELVVSAPAELVEVLRAESTRAASLEDIAAWLRLHEARFSTVALTQPAEELPLAYVPRLARMKDGEIDVFPRPGYAGAAGGASVIQLEHAEDAPLSETQAAPLIERFLAARSRLEAASAEVRRLRAAARIEYVGTNP